MSAIQDFRVTLAHQSTVAKKRNADLFIWWPTELVACCNLKVMGAVKAGAMCRWIQMLMTPEVDKILEIKRVDIEPYNTLKYPILCRPSQKSADNEVIADDVDLVAGDYEVYYLSTDGEESTEIEINPMPIFPQIASFRAERRASKDEFPNARQTHPDLVHDAFERNLRQCFVTGVQLDQLATPGELITNWIFPPAALGYLPFQVKYDATGDPWFDDSVDRYCVIDNLVTMHARVFKLFYKNAFAIDADDNFKVCVFNQSAWDAQLPSHASVPVVNETMKFFFGRHLLWTLALHVRGGSINVEPPFMSYCIDRFMERMRVTSGRLPKNFSSKVWKTRRGQAVRAFLTNYDPAKDDTIFGNESDEEYYNDESDDSGDDEEYEEDEEDNEDKENGEDGEDEEDESDEDEEE